LFSHNGPAKGIKSVSQSFASDPVQKRKAPDCSSFIRGANQETASLPAASTLFNRKNCGLPKREKLKTETLKTEIGSVRAEV